MTSEILTRELVRKHFNYNMNTGVFTWRKKTSSVCNNITIGEEAGCKSGDGYKNIGFMGGLYLTHRLAFYYVLGCCPEFIDHINHDKADNRWINLRPATKTSNGRNLGMRKTNKSGFTGISWHKQRQKWVVQISANGTRKHVGLFKDIPSATAARDMAYADHGYHKNHGRSK